MNVRVPAALAVVLASSLAAASPQHELAGLLRRAQTVALVTIGAHDAHGVTLRANTVYRGVVPRGLRVQIDPAGLPNDVDQYVALSQGDKSSGPPTDDARIGQGIEGQRGYRGWLLYPVRRVRRHDVIDPALLTARDGEVRVRRLAALVAKHPYREAGE